MLKSLIFTLLAAALASAHPAPALESRQGGPSAKVYSKCVNPNHVALTFDDGPYIYLKDISNTLKNAGALGTFFFRDCIYNAAEMSNVKYAYANGHMIGSHTWAHLDLATLTWDRIHDEMWRVELALSRIIGVKPAFMRPPFGSYNTLVRQASYIRNQSLVIWDFDSGDSTGASVAESKSLYDGVVSSHPSNLLALNHETQDTTAHQVLPYAISKLQAAGYKLVTLATCLNLPAYHSVGPAGTPDSSWRC